MSTNWLYGSVCKSLLVISLLVMVFGQAPRAASAGLPVCVSANSDPDGDGFGWENKASCRVGALRRNTCARADSDPDGDGYGWENGKSCVVVTATSSRVNCVRSDSDSDGDGFGWENGRSCVVPRAVISEEKINIPFPACSDQKYDPDSDGFGWENSITCSSRNVGDGGRSITDLVLITGQSNALGAETSIASAASFDPKLDSPVKRAYVYTKTGWSIADLRQIWDLNWYPRTDINNQPANNFAFHFAKHVALNKPQRVVGFILITAPGQQISHWDKGQAFYDSISRKVQRAVNALPQKSKVDAILWHQGESDYYDTNYYSSKLNSLIQQFRAEQWVSNSAAFICGETYNSPVNRILARLNSDADSRTACASSSGLSTVGDDLHFSANSLRVLGRRYALEYLKIIGE